MPKPKREARQEVIKNSAAIQINNKISLLQRRTWNALLFYAYNNLQAEAEHAIPLQDLASLVGYDSHDIDYLKEASKALMRCIVEWNVLDKDGSPEWGATALLAQVKINKGVCIYAYSPELRRRLHNPAMYARLDLNLQKQFESKYSLALWELCTDYLGSGRESGETPLITLEDFRMLMGTETMYPAFMNFNQKVIKPAVEEINRVSDFRVAVEYQRQGRKVTAIKFKISRVLLLPEPSNEQRKLFPDREDMPAAVRELQDAGMSTKDALEIWQQGFGYVHEGARPAGLGADGDAAFLGYIRAKIHLLKRRQASGKIENATGFLLEAIRQNFANPEFAQEQTRQLAAEAQRIRQERERQVKALEQQKAAIEKACGQELSHLCGQVATEAPGILVQAASELLAQSDGFRFLYNQNQSALENYQRTALQAFFHPYMERHTPERFEAVKRHYAAQSAEVDAQIATLRDA